MTGELKPCPFCGHKAVIDGQEDFYYWVDCDSDDCYGRAGFCDTEAQAIAAWNRRDDGLVKELAAALEFMLKLIRTLAAEDRPVRVDDMVGGPDILAALDHLREAGVLDNCTGCTLPNCAVGSDGDCEATRTAEKPERPACTEDLRFTDGTAQSFMDTFTAATGDDPKEEKIP